MAKRRSPPDASRRRFYFVQAAIALAFAAVMLATVLLMPRAEGTPQRWLLAAVPVALLALWAWEFFKLVRDDDEMMRARHLRDVAISGGIVLLGGTMWGILERLLGVPAFAAFLLLPVFATVHGMLSAVLWRRA